MSEAAARPTVLRRTWRVEVRALFAKALWLIGTTSAAFAQSPDADQPPPSFRSLLLDSGATLDEMTLLDGWDGNELTEAQARVLASMLYRLEWAGDSHVRVPATTLGANDSESGASESGEHIGQLVRAEGRVVSIAAAPTPDAMAELEALTLCEVELAGGGRAAVLAKRVPRAWLSRPQGERLDEPVQLTGINLGSTGAADTHRPLVLSDRFAWFPEANVPSGAAWLARHGFDVALLDEVRHHRAFAKPHESREPMAFYGSLATIAQGDGPELQRLAKDSVRVAAGAWQVSGADAAKRRERLAAKLQTAPPKSKPALERELAAAQRQQALSRAVAKRARQGLSSVWPMFLEPQKSLGEMFLIEGTARRAVRIVVNEDEAASFTIASDSPGEGDVAQPPLREYYELDVFTTDAPANYPVICCVARLPQGFPTGDVIREPVRVAGMFFKTWAYVRRAGPEETLAGAAPQRLAPPLIVAPEPQWLRTEPPAGVGPRGLWAGAAVLAALAVLSVVLAKVARRDRLARALRARYDRPLDDLPTPESGP